MGSNKDVKHVYYWSDYSVDNAFSRIHDGENAWERRMYGCEDSEMKTLSILMLTGFIWLSYAALHYHEVSYNQTDINRLNSMVSRMTAPTSQDQRKALVIADIWGIEAAK